MSAWHILFWGVLFWWLVTPSHHHKWGRWSDVKDEYQDRTCTTCGKTKRRWLS